MSPFPIKPLNDPEVVRAEYASEAGLVARASVYQGLAGQDAREAAFEAVSPHFASVSRRDVISPIEFDTDGVRGYVGSSIAHKHLVDRVPDLVEPLVATRRCTVFVAEKAAS